MNIHRRKALTWLFALPAAGMASGALAHNGAPEASAFSTLSALSLALPVAVSVAAPVMLFAAGAMLTVSAVEVSANGTVWILERASDGASAIVTFAAASTGAAIVGVGTVLSVTVLSAGWLLGTAGEAIAFIPNALGESLLYHERIRP